MKKAVFLILIFTFLTTKPVSGIDEDSFVFDSYEFHISRVSNSNKGNGYHIVKLGKDPFEIDYVIDNAKIKINHMTEINGQHIFYGYLHRKDGDTYYDPFLLVLDNEGNEVFLETTDRGDLEAVHKVFELDNLIIVHYRKDTDDEFKDMVFDENIFEVYDYNYNLLDTMTNTDYYHKTEVTDSLYVYTLDVYPTYEGGITSGLDIVYANDVLDIPTDHIFTGEVNIPFVNEALLNGEIVENGIVIDYPGNYELLYNDFNYEFQVDPIVTGVEDEKVYTDPVLPSVSMGNVYLNSDLYVSGDEIQRPGYYTLEIVGLNNYNKTIDFTITSNINGVMNNQVYQDEVEITFEGDGYLNNAYVESPLIVSDPGEYLLKIEGENSYLETYFFEIESIEQERGVVDFVQRYDVVFLAVVVISGGIMLKKK